MKAPLCALGLVLATCSSAPVSYSYGMAPSEKILPNEAKSPTYLVRLLPEHIKDPTTTQGLEVMVSFAGDYQHYPKGLEFSVVEARTPIVLETPSITVATVLDGRVSYFRLSEPINDIDATIQRLRSQKNIPKEKTYFRVSGTFKGKLTQAGCPPKIKLKIVIRQAGKTTEREVVFTLGEREYGRASNRPFG